MPIQSKSKAEADCIQSLLPYPQPLLEQWKKGDYSMLERSRASDYIKNILIGKAKTRPGPRFFGEAFIASTMDMKEGWYNSFKWLTNPNWLSGNGLEGEFERPFYDALLKYFGVEMLATLQNKASLCFQKQLSDLKPVAPDLLILSKDGELKFIESKMPDDTIKLHQVAGLALIKKYLDFSKPVTVSLITLYPQGSTPPKVHDVSNEFRRFYEIV